MDGNFVEIVSFYKFSLKLIVKVPSKFENIFIKIWKFRVNNNSITYTYIFFTNFYLHIVSPVDKHLINKLPSSKLRQFASTHFIDNFVKMWKKFISVTTSMDLGFPHKCLFYIIYLLKSCCYSIYNNGYWGYIYNLFGLIYIGCLFSIILVILFYSLHIFHNFEGLSNGVETRVRWRRCKRGISLWRQPNVAVLLSNPRHRSSMLTTRSVLVGIGRSQNQLARSAINFQWKLFICEQCYLPTHVFVVSFRQGTRPHLPKFSINNI